MNKIIIYALFVISLASCGGADKEAPKEAEDAGNANEVSLDTAQLKNISLSLVQAKEEQISKVFKVNGIIDVPPQNLVSVCMPMGGYLKYTKLLPGMHFNKGEIIAVMEDAKYVDLQQDFLIAQTRLDMLVKEYERQKDLNASKASSDKVFQQSKEAYESAAITYKSLSEKLQLIGLNPSKVSEKTISRSVPIYAPMSGFVSKVLVNIGKYVNPTDVLFELVNPEDIHLSLNVFEKDLEYLYHGMRVYAYTNIHPEKRYACEVILIGKDVGADRSVNVHCHFETYDKNLVPGTYMNAELIGLSKKAWVLPTEAIIHDGADHYVFVQKGARRYQKVKVLTGMITGEQTEILEAEGLKLGVDEIVSKGAYTLWMKLNNVAE
ncbi:MAG: efflux RND transporter periplasmic adaptor subunit [bacterium]|nr:efflux RND transporter periplasmic adaptor subunit [bacterium]